MVTSPGRVNLIGDHTDYNDGLVLPFAIDRYVEIAARRRQDNRVVAISEAVAEPVRFDLANLAHGGPAWGEYLKGLANVCDYGAPGLDVLIRSNVPVAAGLSSSAAIEMGFARLIYSMSGERWDPVEAAALAQRAENEWVGNACGVMDQLVVAGGVEGHALLIDCRTLDTKPLPLPDRVTVLVLDTGTSRELVDTEYNQRRRACTRAAAAYHVDALRDLRVVDLDPAPPQLSATDYHRARHVVTENQRVLDAARALDQADFVEFGRLMVESHCSLRDDYEVTTAELDQMMTVALEQPGCVGARMTGAGFGGCVVALFSAPDTGRAAEAIRGAYQSRTGIASDAYTCRPVAGTSIQAV